MNTSELQWLGMLKHLNLMPASHSCRCEKCWSLNSCSSSCWAFHSLSRSSLYAFALWLAFKMCSLFALLLVRQFPWLSGLFPWFDFLSWFRLMLCHFASCFKLVDLLTWTFLGSCLCVELLFCFIDCCNSVTQRRHQLLAGFRFEAAEPTPHLS